MVWRIQCLKWVSWNTPVSTVISTPTVASRTSAGAPQTTPFTASFTRDTPSRKPDPSAKHGSPMSKRAPAADRIRLFMLPTS